MKFKNEDTFSMGEKSIDRHFAMALKEAVGEFSKHNPMRIGGEDVYSDRETTVVSPINHTIVLGHFQLGRAEHALRAISAANAAFKNENETGNGGGSWRDYEWNERVVILERAASILSSKKFRVAAILSYENGKSRDESIGEVDEAIDFLRYYSLLIRENDGLVITRVPYRAIKENSISEGEGERFGHQGARSEGEQIKILSKPFGVWSVISPFNFPVSISMNMIAAALITGNTVVFKPSFGDNPAPLTGLQIQKVFEAAGLPDGVLNYITGLGREVGDVMVQSPDVRGIAFTGSREVAMGIQEKIKGGAHDDQQKQLPKQFVAEMGSKNPVIVAGTADIGGAVKGTISAAFGFCGQKCSAASRAIVHSSIYERFLDEIKVKTATLRIGDPLDKDVDIGPLIGKSALERYLASVEEAKMVGRIICGGKRLEGRDPYDNGYYVEPVVIEIPESAALFKRELFLPILVVLKYDEFSEAIRIANNTVYGLTAGLYSNNKEEIAYFNDNIESGTVYVNRDVSATTGAVVGQQTFAGWKGSSMGCKGTSSLSYLLQFVREQSQTYLTPQRINSWNA